MNAESDQNHGSTQPARPVTAWLHPRVYTVLIVLTAWFAVAVWSFVGAGLVDYLLVIVTGFIFVTMALMLILSRVGHTDNPADKPPPLREWVRWDYETWTGPLPGAQAATQILLPIVAAAVGMTVIGLIFYATERSMT
jgi:hypothetical protein